MRKLANRMQFGVPEESSLGNFTIFHLYCSPDLIYLQCNVFFFNLLFDASVYFYYDEVIGIGWKEKERIY